MRKSMVQALRLLERETVAAQLKYRPLIDPSPAPSLPERLGKYEIVGVLGQGAMGVVYDAVDPHIDRRVAVKAIRAPLLHSPEHEPLVTARFRTEAQAAGRLSHPNIVSIYEYGEAGDERFIAMEYVRGVLSCCTCSRAERDCRSVTWRA